MELVVPTILGVFELYDKIKVFLALYNLGVVSV